MTEQTIVDEIAGALNESNKELIALIVNTVGHDRAKDFLRQTLEVEAQGGMMTVAGKRRRTPGGVFFKLVKEGASKEERRTIWPSLHRPKRQKERGDQAKAPIVAMTWDEAKQAMAQVIREPGEAKTVKLTLVGRPLKVAKQQNCVVVSMKGKEPPSLPKGLPAVPEGSAITWAVFIANKQWDKVKDSVGKHEEDQLIIEGYPIVSKSGVAAVMAMNCKSVLMERAQREKQKA